VIGAGLDRVIGAEDADVLDAWLVSMAESGMSNGLIATASRDAQAAEETLDQPAFGIGKTPARRSVPVLGFKALSTKSTTPSCEAAFVGQLQKAGNLLPACRDHVCLPGPDADT